MENNDEERNCLQEIETISHRIGCDVDRLIKLLEHENSKIRESAIDQLWKLRTWEVEERLKEALYDEDANVRAGALRCISEWKHVVFLDWVVDFIDEEEEPNEICRSWAATAIGEIGVKSSITLLEERLLKAGELELGSIYFALIRLGKDEYFGRLVARLDHENTRVVISSANDLRELVNDENRTEIRSKLEAVVKQKKDQEQIDSINKVINSIRLEEEKIKKRDEEDKFRKNRNKSKRNCN